MKEQRLIHLSKYLTTSSIYKRWIYSVGGLCICTLGLVMVMNVHIDPYGVFTDVSQHVGLSTLNERYNKMTHLLRNPDRYDTLLLGSSRIGLFNTADVNQSIPGARTYNFSFFSAEPSDYLATLPVLQAQGMKIKRVVIGVDLYPYINSSKKETPQFWHHPRVTGDLPALYWLKYALLPSFYHSYIANAHASNTESKVTHDIEGTGSYSLEDTGYNYTRPNSLSHNKYKLVDEKIKSLISLRDYFHANAIEVTWFIHPFSREQQDSIDADFLDLFRSQIIAILGQLPDFSQQTDITDSDVNYFDRMHYKPSVAAQIIKDVLYGS